MHTPIADSGPPCKTPNINEDGDGDVGGEGNLDDSIPGAFQESVEDYATANSVGSNNKGTCLPGKIARDARTKGSIITAVQWDDAGEVWSYELGVQKHDMVGVVKPSVSEFTRKQPSTKKTV